MGNAISVYGGLEDSYLPAATKKVVEPTPNILKGNIKYFGKAKLLRIYTSLTQY
jgi:hypothetical protein